jgi:hypothetical protein
LIPEINPARFPFARAGARTRLPQLIVKTFCTDPKNPGAASYCVYLKQFRGKIPAETSELNSFKPTPLSGAVALSHSAGWINNRCKSTDGNCGAGCCDRRGAGQVQDQSRNKSFIKGWPGLTW